MSAFRGFSPEAFAFFEGLGTDNSKAYWETHRPIWEGEVRDPMRALLGELEGEFGPQRMFRPNRDMRFAKDASPYKTWAGATSESKAVGGTGYYLSIDASGLVAGCGAMAMARDQLVRFRAAIDAERSGHAFAHLATGPVPVTHGAHPPLKTSPAGYPQTHPRIEYLRWKGAAVVVEHERADWMGTSVILDCVRDVWRGAEPLKRWLDLNVGPSEVERGQ